MFSHGILGSLLLTIFVIGKGSAMSSEFTNFLNGIANAHALKSEQKMKIQNLKIDTNGHVHLHQDCKALIRFGNKPSGIYAIQPRDSQPVLVYCDMHTQGGGWILLQKVNKSSSTSFQRTWSEYKNTFGDFESSYWLGNEHIHSITKQQRHEVKFIVQNGSSFVEVDFASFNIDGPENNYALRLGFPLKYSKYHDPLIINDNMMFSTEDKDNDMDPTGNCAKKYGGGWWFNNCSGIIFNSQHIEWPNICNNCESAAILIRPAIENCVAKGKITK